MDVEDLMDGELARQKYAEAEARARGSIPRERWMWMLALAGVVEVYTHTVIILLNLLSDKSLAYIIFAVTNPPRVLALLWISRQLCPHTWWRYWITLDNLQLNAIVIYVINAWMIVYAGSDTPDSVAGNTVWRSFSVLLTPLMNFAFLGNFRVMLKYFPFSATTLLVYKLLRCYAAVVVTVIQLVLRRGSGQPVAGLDSGLLILYISMQVSFHVMLLGRIPSWTAYKRSAAKSPPLLLPPAGALHAPLLASAAASESGSEKDAPASAAAAAGGAATIV